MEGVSAVGRKTGRRRRGTPRYGAMAQINMTPFIDVMLVLLIIFMVAAPLIASSIPVDLPQVPNAPNPSIEKRVIVTLKSAGDRQSCFGANAYVEDKPTPIGELVANLKDALKGPEDTVIVRGAKDLCFENWAALISELNMAGIKTKMAVEGLKLGGPSP